MQGKTAMTVGISLFFRDSDGHRNIDREWDNTFRAGTGPAPTGDGAKFRKVCDLAKKSEGKIGGSGKNGNYKKLFGRINAIILLESVFCDTFALQKQEEA